MPKKSERIVKNPGITVWVNIHNEDDSEQWCKKMSFPCLPPVGAVIFPKCPKGHNTGVLKVAWHTFDEKTGMFSIFALIDETFDYKKYGFKEGMDGGDY